MAILECQKNFAKENHVTSSGDGTEVFIFYFLNLFILFILFLAALGLRCCARAFSSCGEQGYSSLWCTGFSLQWLLLLRSTGSRHAGFGSCGLRVLDYRLSSYGTGLGAPWHVGSFRTRARTHVPCIGRRILFVCLFVC